MYVMEHVPGKLLHYADILPCEPLPLPQVDDL